MLRAGLEAVVREQPGLELIGTFESIEETPPADVLLTLETPDLEGLRAPVVLILAGAEPVDIRLALRNGVRSVARRGLPAQPAGTGGSGYAR